MIRPFTCVCMMLAAGSGLYLYQSKHQALMLDREINRTLNAVDAAHQRAGLLRAEYALQNDPQRLATLTTQLLPNLKVTAPTQFTTFADLDKRLPPVGPPPGATPPADPRPADTSPTVAAVAPPPTPTAPVVMATSTPPAIIEATRAGVMSDPVHVEPAKPKADVARADPARPDVAKIEPQRPAASAPHPAAAQLASAGALRPTPMAPPSAPTAPLVSRPAPQAPFREPVTPVAATRATRVEPPTQTAYRQPEYRQPEYRQPEYRAPIVGSSLGMARSMGAAAPAYPPQPAYPAQPGYAATPAYGSQR